MENSKTFWIIAKVLKDSTIFWKNCKLFEKLQKLRTDRQNNRPTYRTYLLKLLHRSLKMIGFNGVSRFPPIVITDVFSRLHCRPEIFANCFKIFIHSLRYSGFLCMKILVSSAKVSNRDSFLAYSPKIFGAVDFN